MYLLRQITAAFLVQVFLILAAPKELLHEFFHAKESVDFICEEGCGDHLSGMHEHCDVFQLSYPPLYFSLAHFSFTISEVFNILPFNQIGAYYFSTSPFLFFRGPPALS